MFRSLKVEKLVIVVGGLFVQQQRPISKAGRILSDISESGLSPQQPISRLYATMPERLEKYA